MSVALHVAVGCARGQCSHRDFTLVRQVTLPVWEGEGENGVGNRVRGSCTDLVSAHDATKGLAVLVSQGENACEQLQEWHRMRTRAVLYLDSCHLLNQPREFRETAAAAR